MVIQVLKRLLAVTFGVAVVVGLTGAGLILLGVVPFNEASVAACIGLAAACLFGTCVWLLILADSAMYAAEKYHVTQRSLSKPETFGESIQRASSGGPGVSAQNAAARRT